MRKPRNPRAKALLYTGVAAMGIGLYGWYNGDPHPSMASGGDPLEEFALYGIGTQSASLGRYDFTSDTLDVIGTISDGSTDLTGIKASAYVPRNSKMFTFWSDPSDGLTKLVYVDLQTAKATQVGVDMGLGEVTAAVAAMPTPSAASLGVNDPTPVSEITQYELYAIQETDPFAFAITDSEVVPSDTFAVRVTVLGAAVSYGGTYDMPVTVQVRVDSDTSEPYGPWTQPVDGNVNDDADDDVNNDPQDNPTNHVLPNTYTSGTPVSILSKVWNKTDSGLSGHDNSHWEVYRTVDSSVDSNRVITLRDGDPVPNYDAFLDQATIVDFLEDYIDFTDNTIDLGPNQAIYLIEYNNDLSSSAADFQDLVVLVTLAEDTIVLSDPAYPAEAQLIKVDPTNGTRTTLMTLDHQFDGLAARSAQTFYATVGEQVYELDPVAGTETLVGSTGGGDNMKALEFAGSALYRVSTHNNQLRGINTATGAWVGSELNVGSMSNVGTIQFIRVADEPIDTTASYD